jgi:phosphoglycerate dehydrogenase-like enzyme
MKVLVTELIWPEGLEELQASGEVEYDPDLWRKPEEVQAKVRAADAVVVRNQTRVDAPLLESAGSLRAVGRLGVGLDNIDLEAARTRGVPVVYARNANAVSVAEYVIGAVLLASRNLSAASEDVKSGGWDRGRFGGSEVYGKTLGLVGVGEISRRVARRASAFGMSVVGHDPYVAPYDYPPVRARHRAAGPRRRARTGGFRQPARAPHAGHTEPPLHRRIQEDEAARLGDQHFPRRGGERSRPRERARPGARRRSGA